jgi:galactose mutarotase-like enzyme
MEVAILENDSLRVAVKAQGAELSSIWHKNAGLEYLWSGDPAYWGKQSPVLFPIVGTLSNHAYHYRGQTYSLSRHGFARDRLFAIREHTTEQAVFALRYDAESLKVYPFPFELRITYRLEGDALAVGYAIENLGADEPMYASIGAHPAFRAPLAPGLAYEDYYLEFEMEENAGIYPLTAEGLTLSPARPFLMGARRLALEKSLFYADALVFKELASTRISLKSDKSPHGVHLDFPGFPYFGIWAAKDAPFVCLEPWCGIADAADAGQDMAAKEGILTVAAGAVLERVWRVTPF